MSSETPGGMIRVTDQGIERMVSVLLRTGVLVSGFVVLAGGLYFLWRHGGEFLDFSEFKGAARIDRGLGEIVGGAVHGRARSIIQFGIVLLIATPVLRVACSLVGFALERDRIYVAITALVLAILMYSLFSGHAG